MGLMAKTDLTNQRQVFVEEYVRSGDHLEAAKKAGYKDTHTLRNQACKLRRECADEITDELHRNFANLWLLYLIDTFCVKFSNPEFSTQNAIAF